MLFKPNKRGLIPETATAQDAELVDEEGEAAKSEDEPDEQPFALLEDQDRECEEEARDIVCVSFQ
eukprot:1806713-Amphidinium_carterae.1